MSQTIITRHKVANIDAWINGHNERISLFAPAVSGFKTFQDTNDPKSVIMVIEVTDLEKLQEIINDPKNQKIKNRHTVLEPITISTQLDL